jgi:hypothetical protein
VHPEASETIAEEAVEALDAVEPPSPGPILLLQKMENRLVRHHLAAPDVLSDEELRKLRYILSFARLADFEPGAAGPAGSRGRGDVSVGAEVAPWRAQVADALYEPLREQRNPVTSRTNTAGCSPSVTGTTSRWPNWTPKSATRSSSRSWRGRRSGFRLYRRHAAAAGGRPGA